MNGGTAIPAGGGGSGGPVGGAGAAGCAGAAGFAAGAGLAAAAPTGLAAAGATAGLPAVAAVTAEAGAVGCPVAELVSAVVAVSAAAGFVGFGAGGSARGGPTGAADTPAPGASVRETSPLSGSDGAEPVGLSAAACGGVAASGAFFGSSFINQQSFRNPHSAFRNGYTHSSAPFCHA
jgi:hypothetical protein